MSTQLCLTVQHQNGNDYQLQYELADNPIANAWIKKIKHVSKVPLDPGYTYSNDRDVKEQQLNDQMAKYIQTLNIALGKIYDVKSEYNQIDFNFIHSFVVSNQSQYAVPERNLLNKIHKIVHILEQAKIEKTCLCVDWGENAGLLTGTYQQSPYDYYTLNMQAGNIYSKWAEFGKTPYMYWRDNDLDDQEHFLKNCKPHTTFRPGFYLQIKNETYGAVNEKFDQWFDRFRVAWEKKYQAHKLSEYGQGGVLLATPCPEQIDIFSEIYTVKSIKLMS